MKGIVQLMLLGALLMMTGCAATMVAIEKKDLKVETLMSDTIFLDVEQNAERTIYVDIKNTSDKDFDLMGPVISKLTQRGYTIVNDPKQAGYILQANILQVGQADPSALRTSVYSGYGGALAGGLAGVGIAAATGGHGAGIATGGAIGGIVGGAAELVAGSMVKDVTFSVITDIMISERTTDKVQENQSANLSKGKGTSVQQSIKKETNRQRYQTRIASSANKVNLKFEEALPALQDGLSKSISGIF